MRIKVILAVLVFVYLSLPALAQQRVVDSNSGGTLHLFQPKPVGDEDFVIQPEARNNNLVNHGGPVITSAKVVMIFWGPSFANPAGSQTPGAIADELNAMMFA